VEELREAGRSLAHGRKVIVAGHDKLRDHTDAPDAVGLFSLEIKERTFAFTGPEDFPYPTAIVDDLRGMRRETLSHLAYVYISKKTRKWVWLLGLDRDETWTEEVTFDRRRGHEVPVLVAPKRFLRPASQLMNYLYPHTLLGMVDCDTGGFVRGGGEACTRERSAAAGAGSHA
jgi:hypothetical protein